MGGGPGPWHNLGGPLYKRYSLYRRRLHMHTQPHTQPNETDICVQTNTPSTCSMYKAYNTNTLTCWLKGIPAHIQRNTHTLQLPCTDAHTHCALRATHAEKQHSAQTHPHLCTHIHTHAQVITHVLSHHTHPKPFIHIKTLTNSECTPYTMCRGLDSQTHLGTPVFIHTHTFSNSCTHICLCLYLHTCPDTPACMYTHPKCVPLYHASVHPLTRAHTPTQVCTLSMPTLACPRIRTAKQVLSPRPPVTGT